MNRELLTAFIFNKALAPAGTPSVPFDVLLTASNDIPEWARFTFQARRIQEMQADLDKTRAELELTRVKHEACEEREAKLKDAVQKLGEKLDGVGQSIGAADAKDLAGLLVVGGYTPTRLGVETATAAIVPVTPALPAPASTPTGPSGQPPAAAVSGGLPNR